jgi:hypothetical protein
MRLEMTIAVAGTVRVYAAPAINQLARIVSISCAVGLLP